MNTLRDEKPMSGNGTNENGKPVTKLAKECSRSRSSSSSSLGCDLVNHARNHQRNGQNRNQNREQKDYPKKERNQSETNGNPAKAHNSTNSSKRIPMKSTEEMMEDLRKKFMSSSAPQNALATPSMTTYVSPLDRPAPTMLPEIRTTASAATEQLEQSLLTEQMNTMSITNQRTMEAVPGSMQEFLANYQRQLEDEFVSSVAEKQRFLDKQNAPKSLFNRKKIPRDIVEQTRKLPIYPRKDELIELVKNNQFVIVIGETGSGKSTQIPQYLAEALLHGNGKIGVTQPRRVAAKSLAERVAKECGVKMGTTVGYAVRFDKKVSNETVIKYLTDGLLVKECANESNMDCYSIIIIDEAHERSIHTDVCFGLLKRAARQRKDLKVIISSATLETSKFSNYFNGAPVFKVTGQGFPVNINYCPINDYIVEARDLILRIYRTFPRGEGKGDILVFLPGQDEIDKLWELVEEKLGESTDLSLYDDLWILPLYGGLPLEEQQKVFTETPKNHCKVILATNVAETSITIDGIVYVIDCGYFKQNEYNPKSGIYSLVTKKISKFQAIQRAGRAGRTRDGVCYRLYSENEFKNIMKEAQSPEITRCNVESVILELISMGISDPMKFEFMDPPPMEALAEALIHLQDLGALNENLALTNDGRRMSEFPLDPPLARVLLESDRLGCSQEVLKIIALLSTQVQSLFNRSKRSRQNSDLSKAQFKHKDGDLILLLKVYDAWLLSGQNEDWCRKYYIQPRLLVEAEEIRTQLAEILRYRGISQSVDRNRPTNIVYENIRKAFTAGYFRRVALKKPRGHAYQIPGTRAWNPVDVYLHPSSNMFHEKRPWVIYHEMLATTKPYIREVIAIEPQWIKEYAPVYVARMAKFGVYFG